MSRRSHASWLRWLRSFRTPRPSTAVRRRGLPLRLEPLEARELLASTQLIVPTATISGAPSSSPEGKLIWLTGSATEWGTTSFSYNWTVTKNNTAFAFGAGANFAFTPDDNGNYVVTLAATDQAGRTANTSTRIKGTNVAPTAVIAGAPASALTGSPIALTASATDPSTVDTAAGFIYAWSVTKDGGAYTSGAAASLTFTPAAAGTYVATLSATDKNGGVGTTSRTIQVTAPPLVTASIAGAPAGGPEGTPITLTGSAAEPGSAASFGYAWAVTKNGAAFASGSGPTFTFTPDDNGSYVAKLTATDQVGASGTASVTIGVTDVAPTVAFAGALTSAAAGTSTTATVGSAVTLSGSATDPSSVDTAAGFGYAWSVTKDGSPYTSGAGGSLTFTPVAAGTYVATLSATDKDGAVGAASTTVSVVAPGQTGALTASIAGAPAGSPEGTAIDLTGSATGGAALGLPPYAQVGLSGQAAWTWAASTSDPRALQRPGAADRIASCWFSGSAFEVDLNLTDGQQHQVALYLLDWDRAGRSQRVDVLDAATGAVLDSRTASGFGSGQYLVYNLSGHVRLRLTNLSGSNNAVLSGLFFDPAGAAGAGNSAQFLKTDTATQGSWQGVYGAEGLNIVGFDNGNQYAWAVTKEGAAYGSGAGASFSFTPDDNGVYAVTLTVTDRAGGTGSAAKAIAVTNAAPAAAIAGAPGSVPPGSLVSLTGSATDAGADTAAGFTYAWAVTRDGAAYGSGTGGSFRFTAAVNGVYAVTLTATDKDGAAGATSKTIYVGVYPPPTPVIGGVPAGSPEGAPITLTGSATSSNPADVAAGFSYGWAVTKNGAAFASGAGASFAFTPNDNGTYVVTLTATGQGGAAGTASTSVNVTNAAPTATITGAPISAAVGTAVSLTASASDPGAADAAAGFTYSWAVTRDGSAFASGAGASFSFTPNANGTYAVTLTAADKDGAAGTTSKTIFGGSLSAIPGHLLLPDSTLAALRQQAAANTPRWQAFKARLDQNLTQFLNYGDYQGSELIWIADYALGYQILKDSDPLTAANYADKAIAVMKSGLRDLQKGGWETRQFLARGDGTTRTFTLPNADVIPATVHVYVGSVWTKAVVRDAAYAPDIVDYYSKFLKVSNTPDGPAGYVEGVDWRHSSDLRNNLLDWSLPGKEPAAGSTYYVTETSAFGAPQAAFTLSGNTITLSAAPTAGQAVFVEYIYGTHSADGSTLAYQQTSGGDGGFNSIMIDDSYTSRFLGKYEALGYNWLDGYAGFTPSLKSETASMLVRWSDYVRDYGYFSNSPASNYGAGAYVSRVLTALALKGNSAEAPRLLSEILAYRTANLLPVLQNTTRSLKGGYWSEGWGYGELATRNLLEAGLALEEAGQVTAAPERQWASEVVHQLVGAQPSQGTVYDGGDWYAYPSPLPSIGLFYELSAMASDPVARSYANYIVQNYPGGDWYETTDLLFHDPSAPASFWSAEPLQYFASGTGLLTARSDWGASPTWVAAQIGNLLGADHQSYTPGQLQIQRGADDLLINSDAPGKAHLGISKSTYGNTIVVDDNGEGTQTYRYSMGYWYGDPGVTVTAYEAGGNYVYLAGDYRAAYSPASAPGSGGPVSELTREVVYLRPDYVVVYDRVTTVKDYYTKQQRWHFLNAPTVSGNSFVETVGSSRLFGQTYSTTPLTTTVAPLTLGGATVQELITQNASPTASVRYLTDFQVAPSTTAAMVSTRQILSADGRMEGTQMGNQVVLFGRNGTVDATTPVSFSVSGSTSLQNLLVDLQAGGKYQVQVNGTVLTTVTASTQGTLSFTTPAGAQTVTVTKVG